MVRSKRSALRAGMTLCSASARLSSRTHPVFEISAPSRIMLASVGIPMSIAIFVAGT